MNSEDKKRKILEVVCLFIKSKDELRDGYIVKHLEYFNNAKNILDLYFPDQKLDEEEMFRCCESLYYQYTGFTVESRKREIWGIFLNKK